MGTARRCLLPYARGSAGHRAGSYPVHGPRASVDLSRTAVRLGSRRKNVVQAGGLRCIALEMRIAQSAVVVDVRDCEVVPILCDQLNRRSCPLCRADCILQHIGVIAHTVDCKNPTSLGELRPVGRALPENLRDRGGCVTVPTTVSVTDDEPNRVKQVQPMRMLFGSLLVVAFGVVVYQPVATSLQSLEQCLSVGRVQTLMQEGGPVIRLDGIERLDQIVEGVSHRNEASIVDAKESAREIIE